MLGILAYRATDRAAPAIHRGMQPASIIPKEAMVSRNAGPIPSITALSPKATASRTTIMIQQKIRLLMNFPR